MSARFGQVVVGPPGSGKTTYCDGMQQFLGALGRDTAVVNLDPANETYEYVDYAPVLPPSRAVMLPGGGNGSYECAVDISDLISVQDVMEELELGPNGGKASIQPLGPALQRSDPVRRPAMLYCMEFLLANIAWLDGQLEELSSAYCSLHAKIYAWPRREVADLLIWAVTPGAQTSMFSSTFPARSSCTRTTRAWHSCWRTCSALAGGGWWPCTWWMRTIAQTRPSSSPPPSSA